MRKIETQLIQAIRDKRNWQSSNTRTKYVPASAHNEGDYVEVYLFGHNIASVADDRIVFSDCGYQTVTTKSRLNAIFNAFGRSGEGISQRKFNWYLQRPNQEDLWIAHGSTHSVKRVTLPDLKKALQATGAFNFDHVESHVQVIEVAV